MPPRASKQHRGPKHPPSEERAATIRRADINAQLKRFIEQLQLSAITRTLTDVLVTPELADELLAQIKKP